MADDVTRWSVIYTKNIKQKRKVYQDGFLEVQASSHKVKLYDNCDKLLESKIVKREDDAVKSGETITLGSYVVDIGKTIPNLILQRDKFIADKSHMSSNTSSSLFTAPSQPAFASNMFGSNPSGAPSQPYPSIPTCVIGATSAPASTSTSTPPSGTSPIRQPRTPRPSPPGGVLGTRRACRRCGVQTSYVCERKGKSGRGGGTHPAENEMLVSISARPSYKHKSHEEIRWDFYQLRDNGGPNLNNNTQSPPFTFTQLNTNLPPTSSNPNPNPNGSTFGFGSSSTLGTTQAAQGTSWGSRVTPYAETLVTEIDRGSGTHRTDNFKSISAMDAYKIKAMKNSDGKIIE